MRDMDSTHRSMPGGCEAAEDLGVANKKPEKYKSQGGRMARKVGKKKGHKKGGRKHRGKK